MLNSRLSALLLIALLGIAHLSDAREAIPVAADPVLQERMNRLASVLRCLVCQNQTIADSHAELADDLRKQILEQMQQGRSDQEILDYMVARYGDFVLYRPPLKLTTILLWAGPGLLVALGGVLVYRAQRQTRLAVPGAAPEQLERARQLLDADGEGVA